MRYRKLRIAWSVGWGIACVLLIVLWVRSNRLPHPWMGRYGYASAGAGELILNTRLTGLVIFRFWVVVLVTASVAAASWFPWPRSFSLRTLLIATTLVAVVLGLAVYASRH